MNQAPSSHPLIVVTGPTAAGKTAVGVEICRAIGGEMISADSMQVYRGLDIGTAKVTPDELNGIPCHLIDILDPIEEFNAARFISLADEAIAAVRSRGRVPVVVGGTGLYLKGFLYGMFDEPSRDEALRMELRDRMSHESPSVLHAELARLDPVAASRIDPTDRHRIERALEVYHVTGRPISEWQSDWEAGHPRIPHRLFILTLPREELYRRINVRVDTMLAAGWVEEVRDLMRRFPESLPHCFKSIGYREIVAFLEGRMTREEMTEEIKKQTRRFAKRQLTWFRKMPAAEWIDIEGLSPTQGAGRVLDEISNTKEDGGRS